MRAVWIIVAVFLLTAGSALIVGSIKGIRDLNKLFLIKFSALTSTAFWFGVALMIAALLITQFLVI